MNYILLEEIINRLVEIFNSEIGEVKLLRLLYDNKFNYKTKNRKFKFRTNNIKGIGDWGLGPIPNPQSPISKPQSPIPNFRIQ